MTAALPGATQKDHFCLARLARSSTPRTRDTAETARESPLDDAASGTWNVYAYIEEYTLITCTATQALQADSEARRVPSR